MHVITRVVWDMETLEILERDMRPYDGPWALAKGETGKGLGIQSGNAGLGQAAEDFATGQDAQQPLLPFLVNELQNPSGFGQPAVNAMTTQAGQAASGAVSGAKQNAELQSSRSGNPAAQSAIIANAARTGANAETNAATNVQVQNAMEKMKEQQAGAAGLGSLGATDLGDALKGLGVANEGADAWANSENAEANMAKAFTGII